MQGQYRPCITEHPVPGVQGLEINGRQRRVPVVAVENIRRKIQLLAHLQRCPREQDKSEVLVRARVKFGAAEQFRALQQVNVGARPF